MAQIGASKRTFEYDTPVWSFVMMWSTPSSRKTHVVARSDDDGGIGIGLLDDMVAEDEEEPIVTVKSELPKQATAKSSASINLVLHLYAFVNASNSSPQIAPSTPVEVGPSREPSVAHHLRKFSLRRELADRLDQILV